MFPDNLFFTIKSNITELQKSFHRAFQSFSKVDHTLLDLMNYLGSSRHDCHSNTPTANDCKTRLCWCFRCCVCLHQPSSKDGEQWEMSEEKEKSDKGRSLGGLLLDICQINHTHKKKESSRLIPPPRYLLCLSISKTISRLQRCVWITVSKERGRQKKTKKKQNNTKGDETIPHRLSFSLEVALKSGEICIPRYLGVNNAVISLLFPDFTLSPFSVGGCFGFLFSSRSMAKFLMRFLMSYWRENINWFWSWHRTTPRRSLCCFFFCFFPFWVLSILKSLASTSMSA